MALTDSLISYWKLDEGSGVNAADAHGTNELTDNNVVGSTTGKIGNARSFNGSNTYFSRASNASLTTGDIDFSVCAWVNFSAKANVYPLVAKHDDIGSNNASEWSLAYSNSADRVNFGIENASDVGTFVSSNNFGAMSTSVWYFLVAWHDSVANTINIQVNNGTVDSAAWTTGARSSSCIFTIGTWANADPGRYMNGLIDEVGFWKKVLTSDERTQLWNSGNGLTYPFALANLKTLNNRAKANLKTINSRVLASIKSYNGLT